MIVKFATLYYKLKQTRVIYNIYIIGLNEAPNCWAIVTVDRQARALVAKESELYLVDQGGQYQQQVIFLCSSSVWKCLQNIQLHFIIFGRSVGFFRFIKIMMGKERKLPAQENSKFSNFSMFLCTSKTRSFSDPRA